MMRRDQQGREGSWLVQGMVWLALVVALPAVGCGETEVPAQPQAKAEEPVRGQGEKKVVKVEPSKPQPKVASKGPEPGSRYWVWVRGQEPGDERTFEVREISGELIVVSKTKGIHLWLDGSHSEIRREPHKRQKCFCDYEEMTEVCPKGSFNTVYSVALLQGDKKTQIQKAPWETARGMNSVKQELEVVATLGPYAAFHEYYYFDEGCGSHGSWNTSYLWQDLRSGESVPMHKLQPIPANVKRKLKEKVCDKYVACHTEDDDGKVIKTPEAVEQTRAECDPEIDALEPVWGTDGFVRRYIGTVSVPYACSTDDGAYTLSAHYGAVPFTGEFEQLAEIPASVHKFVKSLPSGTSLGGVYEIPEESPSLKSVSVFLPTLAKGLGDEQKEGQ